MLSKKILIVTLLVAGLGAGTDPGIGFGQVSVMPLSVAPDPSQDDDLGPELSPDLTPIPVNAAPMPVDGADPFTAYGYNGYNPGSTNYAPGPIGSSGNVIWQPGVEAGWHWQMFPHGLMYPAYLASQRESRFAATFFSERKQGGLVDAAVGGRVGMFRFGTDDLLKPEGFQLDVEGAAFPRLTLNDTREFVSTDFRAGLPLTFRRGWLEMKLAYYHYCSHLGDTYIKNHGGEGHPYTRDAVVLGLGLRPREDFRLYAEADYAFYTFGNPMPWQFQFGLDWSTLQMTGLRGAPFFAINSMIRQDVNFAGNLTVQTGWQWRGQAGQSLRTGFHYFNGKSNQGQFYNRFEEQLGLGLWYDY
jgi:hypothetical protein